MSSQYLTIKELTEAVPGNVTPRMVRHYHQIGLLPMPKRSPSNYRLYTPADVQRLNQIVALKQQGFQLAHIHHLLAADTGAIASETLLSQLQAQYRRVVDQLAQLRQTASALEGILGHDLECQTHQAAAIAQLQTLEVSAQQHLSTLDRFWDHLDDFTLNHPEAFEESLQRLLPDLSNRSEIEVDLLTQLVLACGDVSLVSFVQLSDGAIAAARHALQASCPVVADIPAVVSAFDHPRLAHLGCSVTALLNDPHITSASEAEQACWQDTDWKTRLHQRAEGAIVVIGYAPSLLRMLCELIAHCQLQPALVIAFPIGFSHAPVAKRQLTQAGVPYLTVQGALGGGLLAATALNALVTSVIEKPNCHCYLGS